MTAFVTGNLPSDITTVEELAVWCALVLREAAPTQTYIEAQGIVNYQADVAESVNPDGKPFVVCRFVFEQNPLSTVTGKRWNATKPIPRAAEIPTYYTST